MSCIVVATSLIGSALLLLALKDIFQRREPTYRIYPVIGHFVTSLRRLVRVLHLDGTSDRPFGPRELAEIRSRALTGNNISSFGSDRSVQNHEQRPGAPVALIPSEPDHNFSLWVGGSLGMRRVCIPLLNFGALGLGPVNENVVRTFGLAARRLDCLQNTGEDGLTTLHAESGSRLVWQIGTGYWGCLDESDTFSFRKFAQRLGLFNVELVELKLSQGAKPGAGGFVPALKNTPRVARLLEVEPGVDLRSPPHHRAFSDKLSLLTFLKRLATCADGRPVGIKLCVGTEGEFRELATLMREAEIVPDFITVDGAEGGTGAAPTELQKYCGLPTRRAIALVHKILTELGLRERTTLFSSGGIRTGFDLYDLLAAGADASFFTRAPMVAIGCVQARECHLGTCPSGLATHTWWRRRAITPNVQADQLANYYKTVQEGLWQLMAAAGLESKENLTPDSLLHTPPRKE